MSESTETEKSVVGNNQKPTEHILQFFTYTHLPPHLARISSHFCDLAEIIVEFVPDNAERQVALRKVLEAKDAAVRAVVAKS